MRTGLQMQEIVPLLYRQESEKHDYLIGTSRIEMQEDGKVKVQDTSREYNLSKYALGQISTYLNIPREYVRRISEDSPRLLSQNINHWLNKKQDRRLIRTLGKDLRAFLSDRYKVMDNYPLLEMITPVFTQHNLQIISSNISEEKMYIKALSPKLKSEVKVGDVVQAGICISNSEVGAGSLSIQPLIYRLACTNGMVTDAARRKYHVGRKLDEFETFNEYITDETRKAEEKTLFLCIRDIINGSLMPMFFEHLVGRLRKASDQKISGKVENVVEVTRKRFGIGEEIGSTILESLVRSSDFTQWGLANAITDTANSPEVGSYDRSSELERIGGKIIELNPKEWEVLAS
jgi:hypothetical protein